VPALDDPHEITDSIDVISHDIRQFEARNLILNRDYQFEAIEPVSPEVIAKARFVCDALRFDAEMAGYNFANLERYLVLHRRLPCFSAGTNQYAMLLTSTPEGNLQSMFALFDKGPH
jgi:hypothetical protein